MMTSYVCPEQRPRLDRQRLFKRNVDAIAEQRRDPLRLRSAISADAGFGETLLQLSISQSREG